MRIELPASTPGNWRFDYGVVRSLLCISEVHTPVGGVDRVAYTQAGGDSGHQFPNNAHEALPRVMSLISEPGFGQPDIEVRYDYALDADEGPNTRTNFLGLNAPGLAWQDNHRDNLYRANNSYRYGSKEMLWDRIANRPLRTITRRFNNFHLLVSERTEQNDHVTRSETAYHLVDGATFDQQPPYFQLPKEQLSYWQKPAAGGDTRIDRVTSEFDVHGNLLKQVNADGTVEEHSWYPAAGEGQDCPPDPHGFVRYQRDTLQRPAAVEAATGTLAAPLHRTRCEQLAQPPKVAARAPTLKTHFRYAALLSAQSQRPWVARISERLLDISATEPVELQLGSTFYHEDPDLPFLLGHVEHVEILRNGHTSKVAYAYSLMNLARANETVLQTITTQTGFDGLIKTTTSKVSLLNGFPLQDNDDSGVERLYTYDALGRTTGETTAPGTAFQAARAYRYSLTRVTGQQASQTTTDVAGAKRTTYLDGLGRTVREERVPQPGALPIQIYAARYDSRGHLTHETSFDNLDGQALELTTEFRYDDWAQLTQTHHPDGVIDCKVNDPIQLSQSSWQQDRTEPPLIVGRSHTQLNLFGKPAVVRLLDEAGNAIATETYGYDGLARGVEYIGPMGTLTEYEYDVFGRLLASVLPDRTRIETTWVEHSADELATAITVVPSNPSLPAVVVGRQHFDSLDRLVTAQCGPRIRANLYRAQQMQPYASVTASGQQVNYQYQTHLTTEPTRITSAEEDALFTYHPTTAQLQTSTNTRGSHTYRYDEHRHRVEESWAEPDPVSGAERRWTVASNYSQDGRLLNRTDVTGLQTLCGYDTLGRLKTVSEGQLAVDYQYDSLGRPWKSTSSQGNQRIVTTLTYDALGNEVSRTLDLNGHFPRVQTLHYRADGRAVRRTLEQGGNLLLQEDYRYDTRGRLDRYECTGSELPGDRYGNRIRLQLYVFDALDNITLLRTTFADGSNDMAQYRFASDDPCQLVGITHTHPAYPAAVELTYDADGHLTRDENGQALHYDSLGRLTTVTAADGAELCSYHYDGHNLLIGTRRQRQPLQRRFYRDGRLNSTEVDAANAAGTQASEQLNYLFGGAQPVGQQRTDGSDALLFMTDFKNSVIGESSATGLVVQTYGAYGEHPDNGVLQSLLGYTGEVRDPVSGWYLLGQGYRAYNPSLMRFHSPDSFSPFNGGGVNPYCYGLGDPIGYSDPSGHLGMYDYVGIALGVFAITVATLGAAGPVATLLGGGAIAAEGVAALVFATLNAVSAGVGFGTLAANGKDSKRAMSITGWVLDGVSFFSPMGLAYLAKNGWINLVKGAANGADDVAEVASRASGSVTPSALTPPPAPLPSAASTQPSVNTSAAVIPTTEIATPIKPVTSAGPSGSAMASTASMKRPPSLQRSPSTDSLLSGVDQAMFKPASAPLSAPLAPKLNRTQFMANMNARGDIDTTNLVTMNDSSGQYFHPRHAGDLDQMNAANELNRRYLEYTKSDAFRGAV
jgi:RHS repeat-associated protein